MTTGIASRRLAGRVSAATSAGKADVAWDEQGLRYDLDLGKIGHSGA